MKTNKEIKVMTVDQVVAELHACANPKWVSESQQRFGITTTTALGIRVPVLQAIAKRIGKNQRLALQLWKTGIHEARQLAAMIAEPDKIDEALMERWLSEFNSWDIVDGVCFSAFIYTDLAWNKAVEWTNRKPEFEKRAGFTMMAGLAVHDKTAPDKKFERFFPLIEKHATDSRNFVKKAVNWALRQIGKRNENLCKQAILVGESILNHHPIEIKNAETRAARWIANDALRELKSISEKRNWK